jgi:hypothetical protein
MAAVRRLKRRARVHAEPSKPWNSNSAGCRPGDVVLAILAGLKPNRVRPERPWRTSAAALVQDVSVGEAPRLALCRGMPGPTDLRCSMSDPR